MGLLSAVGSVGADTGLTSAIQSAIMQNPTIAKVAATATDIKAVGSKLSTVQEDTVSAVKDAVDTQVQQSLATAGVSPDGIATEGSATSEMGQTSGGGIRYELVKLTVPVHEPLYVYYENGKPIYFTHNERDEATIIPIYPARRKAHRSTKKAKRGKKGTRHN
jgi:hypothetical protein